MHATRKLAAGIDGAAGVTVNIAPRAHHVVVLESEAKRIHHTMAAIARRRRAMLFESLAHGERFLARLRFLELLDTRRRRIRRRAGDVLEDERSAQHG